MPSLDDKSCLCYSKAEEMGPRCKTADADVLRAHLLKAPKTISIEFAIGGEEKMQEITELQAMMAAVRFAGRIMLDDFTEIQSLSIGGDGVKDFVAKLDQHVAQVLSDKLMTKFPGYGLLMEGAAEIEGTNSTKRWIVDPMDGTANFELGLPHWASSVALEDEGKVTAAVVYDPFKDEMFSAIEGGGAWLNGKTRLRTSGKDALMNGMLSTGMPPHGSVHLPRALRNYETLLNECAGVRQWGAAALDLAYVAAGRLDGYWNRNLKLWHFAAGVLLVREAGGLVAPLERGSKVEKGDLVGIARGMFPEFEAALKSS